MKKKKIATTAIRLLLLWSTPSESSSDTTTAARIQQRQDIYVDYIQSQVAATTLAIKECSCKDSPLPFDGTPLTSDATAVVGIRSVLPLFAPSEYPQDDALQGYSCRLSCRDPGTGDFDLAHLVRLLFTSHDSRDFQQSILNTLQDLQHGGFMEYWLHPYSSHARTHVYWTENHIILWCSSEYLVRQFSNEDIPYDLQKRIEHYLQTKINHGFYEFFSPVYYPRTLAGLLNLVDFCTDSNIQSMAVQVSNKLLKQILLFVNDEGSFYPVAGRSFVSRYEKKLFSPFLYFGDLQGSFDAEGWKDDYIASFLLTSQLDLAPIVNSWEPVLDTEFTTGHDVQELSNVHADLTFVDRVMFYWSAGAYFDKNVINDSLRMLADYNLSNHPEFKDSIGFLLDLNIPNFVMRWIAALVPSFAASTNISGATVRLFKNHGTILASLLNFRPRTMGGQVYSWMATVGDIAVRTQSGVTGSNFAISEDENMGLSNSHLPSVVQDSNVVLISYFPPLDMWLLGGLSFLTGINFNPAVALHFPTERFDEVGTIGNWIMGRRHESYIGVWRPGGDTRKDCPNGDNSCDPYYFHDAAETFMKEQVWAAVVGNNVTHVSFENFCDIVGRGTVTGKLSFRGLKLQYQTSVEVDDRRIDGVMD